MDHAETVSVELVVFRNTRFHDSVRHILHLLTPPRFNALKHEGESCES